MGQLNIVGSPILSLHRKMGQLNIVGSSKLSLHRKWVSSSKLSLHRKWVSSSILSLHRKWVSSSILSLHRNIVDLADFNAVNKQIKVMGQQSLYTYNCLIIVQKTRSRKYEVTIFPHQKLNHNQFGAPIHMSYRCSCYFDENNHMIKHVAWNFDYLTDDCRKVPRIFVFIKSLSFFIY